MSFHYSIVSYDFHTYFKLDEPEQVAYVAKFKQSIESEFKDELAQGLCRLFKTYNEPIGPHADGHGMFESDTRDPATFLKLLNFYQVNHGPLSVLIHPRSDKGELIDHTHHALWLGEMKPLKTHLLHS
jgi:DOPA 4,5-dioxygenase